MVDQPHIFLDDELMDYVRGAASPDLSERLEAAMRHDPALRAEVALMRGLKPAMELSQGANPPGELGWRRLKAEIELERASAPPKAAMGRIRIWQAAAILLLAVGVGEAAYIATLPQRSDPALYRTASKQAEMHVLGVIFAPDARIVAINALLSSADARLLDGPSALGLYRVAFETGEALSAGRTVFEESEVVDLVAEE